MVAKLWKKLSKKSSGNASSPTGEILKRDFFKTNLPPLELDKQKNQKISFLRFQFSFLVGPEIVGDCLPRGDLTKINHQPQQTNTLSGGEPDVSPKNPCAVTCVAVGGGSTRCLSWVQLRSWISTFFFRKIHSSDHTHRPCSYRELFDILRSQKRRRIFHHPP